MERGVAICEAARHDNSLQKFSGGFVLGLARKLVGEERIFDADDVVAWLFGRSEQEELKGHAEEGKELLLREVNVRTWVLHQGFNPLVKLLFAEIFFKAHWVVILLSRGDIRNRQNRLTVVGCFFMLRELKPSIKTICNPLFLETP